ncbi:MAG: AraC family transcriptional regulator [Rhodospirillales bacterium]
MVDRTTVEVGPRRFRPAGTAVTSADLQEMAVDTDAETFHISAPVLARKDTAIHGRMNNMRGHSGLFVHATDTVEAHDLLAEWDMSPACTVAVMLEGDLVVKLDGFAVRLGPGDGGAKATGHIWSLTKTSKMVRLSRKGTRVRKVIVTVPWDWIDRILADKDLPNRNLARFAATHRGYATWQPSAHAVALAEQIINPSRSPAALAQMSAESRAIEILREALESLIADSPEQPHGAPGTKVQAKAQTVRAYLRAHLADPPTLKAMGRDLGMSVGAMQGAFKAVYGRTIADYSRELRLQRAREAIERDGVSVAQAAYDAGYSNPANFSTAFKRLFGLSPSETKT